MINRWMYQDAYWWEFWMPQSGIWGGMIGSLLVMGLTICVFHLQRSL